MAKVALVTGDVPPTRLDAEDVAKVDAPLVAILEQHGVEVCQPSWRDGSVAWETFDLALVRTTWDYVDLRDEFVAWAARTGARTRLWNPPEVLRWNTHKSYLLELEDRGAPIVPTAWVARGDRIDLGALVRQRGWDEIVIKPAVDAGSRRLLRAGRDEFSRADDHLARLVERDDALIQPYLPSVGERGELSVVVVDGAVSHVVRKRPAAGDFRVQSDFGGVYERALDTAEAERLAEWIVGSTGHDLLVARVDLVEGGDGQLQLIELEATEPDLFFTLAAETAKPLADAIVARLR